MSMCSGFARSLLQPESTAVDRDHTRCGLQDHRRGPLTAMRGVAPATRGSIWCAAGAPWDFDGNSSRSISFVIAVTVLLIIVLMHNIAQQQFMVIMHAAGQPVDPAAGQRAYDAAVEAQIYPTIAVAAVVAIGLSFLAVTLALRPLTAVSEATRQMARGAAPAVVATNRRDEIGGVADSVNALAQSLQRLEELRRQVTNDVAHELRTPLHNLLGLIEGMRDGVIPAFARTPAAGTRRGRASHCVGGGSARPLRRAIGERSDDPRAVRTRDGRARGRRLDSAPVWHGAISHARCTCPEQDLVVEGDAGRLGQIVGNILDNAIRYARRRNRRFGSRIAASGFASVRVSTHDTGDHVDDAALSRTSSNGSSAPTPAERAAAVAPALASRSSKSWSRLTAATSAQATRPKASPSGSKYRFGRQASERAVAADPALSGPDRSMPPHARRHVSSSIAIRNDAAAALSHIQRDRQSSPVGRCIRRP